MTKHLLTAAVVMLATTGAVQAEGATHQDSSNEAGIGTAISGTANAAYQKTAEGVNTVRKNYHQTMANTKAEAARENLRDGNFGAAAEDARNAAKHQAEAQAAARDAQMNNDKADKSWNKAKKAAE